MGFKFSSIHKRSSNYSPNLPPPNLSYFTQQPIRAGFGMPDGQTHWEFHRSPDPNPTDLWEAMLLQRELVKERIRAEIIAKEIRRRRIMERERVGNELQKGLIQVVIRQTPRKLD